jgi:hypothetical protein
VDILAWRSKTSRMHAQIKDFCAILSGETAGLMQLQYFFVLPLNSFATPAHWLYS